MFEVSGIFDFRFAFVNGINEAKFRRNMSLKFSFGFLIVKIYDDLPSDKIRKIIRDFGLRNKKKTFKSGRI